MKAAAGLLLPSREVVLWRGGDVRYVVDAAKQAEQMGYDSVWVGDSLLARPRGEPLTLLAAIAGATARVQLSTAVLLPLLRRPVQLAHVLATLDRVAGGRVTVGIGPGADAPGTRDELAAVDMPPDHRVGNMLAAIDRCRLLWRGEDPHVRLLPEPATPGGPHVWIAAHGPRLLRATGAKYDGWLPFSPTAAEYARGWSAVREAAAQAGRDESSITPAVYLTLAVDADPSKAAQQFDTYIREYYGVPGEVMAKRQASHAGTVESATEWIAGYVEAGARHVVLRIARPGLDGYVDAAADLLRAMRAAQ